MKKYLITLMLMTVSINMWAQLAINLQLPQVGIIQKSQLWNLTLINAGRTTISVKLNMILTDIATGQPVLSGSTNTINVSQGARLIQYNELLPITYTLLNSNYGIDPSSNGFLPVGIFTICYQASKEVSKDFESVAEECTNIEVEPLSPPYLTFPENESEIEEGRPLFSWLPPNPISLFSNLSYSLKLVEVLDNQQSSEAIQQNLPLVFQSGIGGNTLNYPNGNSELDTGKVYAWQVSANNNNLFVANSEIWTFKIKKTMQENVPPADAPFYKLKKEPGTSYFVCDGVLKYEYINELNDKEASVNIYDISNRSKKQLIKQYTEILRDGQNLVSVDLKDDGFKPGHIYTMDLINSSNEAWSCSFEYKPK